MARKCFYSFHYKLDSHRAARVRNIGVIEGNQSISDNDWESLKNRGDAAVEKWIDAQMLGRSCAIVLVGAETANRKWINREIVKAWDKKMGVVGIRIHGLVNLNGHTSSAGANPFDYINYGNTGKKLSSIVEMYDPEGVDSTAKYNWIVKYLEAIVEKAIKIRQNN